MRLKLASALAVALLAGLSAPVDVAVGLAAPVPPSDEVIAYGDTAGAERTIRVVRAGTGQLVASIGGPGQASVEPAVSALDDRLAFARRAGGAGHDLHVADIDGSHARRLTTGSTDDRQPAWSPVANRIAFVRSDPIRGTANIVRIGADGSGLTNVTGRKRGRFDATPAWSPDGATLVFARATRTTFPRLYVRPVPAGGTAPVPLTDGSCMDANPAWGGAGIVFDRTCPGELPDLWIVQPDGSAAQNLTSTPGVAEFDADWSPDGADVVFSTHTDASGDANLARSPLTPWAPIPVPSSSASELGADWQALPEAPAACDPGGCDGSDPQAGPAAPAAGDEEAQRVTAAASGTSIAPGIRFRRIRDRKRRQRLFVLTINMDAGPRMGTALARDTLPGFERTTTMAKRNGAIAAVNGDFGLPSGRPAHHFAMDGDLKQTSRAYGYHFGPAADGSTARTGHRDVTLESVVARGERWMASRWNDGHPTVGQIAAYSPVAKNLEHGPALACSVRVTEPAARQWAEGEDGIETEHAVLAKACGGSSMSEQGGIVLSARPLSEEASFLRGLVVGESVTLRWSMGWLGVADTLGGYPQLVRNGQVLVGRCRQPLCDRHPRTGVAIRADGTILLVVADGRRREARGLTLRAFARRLKGLGAVRALNLDGGGSSTMWIRGKGIVNIPSDGRERYVSSALLVLQSQDDELARSTTTSPSSIAPAPLSAGRLVTEDAGSTGGFLDALAAGVTPDARVPVELRDVLRRFREAAG